MNALKNEEKSIVFIGDSITDCGRTYPTVSEYGYGFAALCIQQLQAAYPRARLYNRGVSGECIGQVHARWERDCLALKPGLVSILVGINDVDYSYRMENHPFEEERLARQLEEMYASVKEAGAGLMVMEPYAFDGELYRDSFAPRLIWLQETTARLAARYADAYIRPSMTRELTQDGVHPTPEGHRLLCQCWMAAAREKGLWRFLAE